MGTERNKSSGRLKIRVSLHPEQRNTLIPCPSCEGSGTKVIEDGNRYRQKVCIWCEGLGLLERRMLALFQRWLRIYSHNRVTRKCPNLPPRLR